MTRFTDDSVLRRVFRENVLFLGGGRALLMQLAHPGVAQGVADHSDFAEDPFSRLRRTIQVVDAIVFGDDDQADRSAAALRAVHARVRGNGYDATDPELLFWVHATLVDTGLRIYNGFVRPPGCCPAPCARSTASRGTADARRRCTRPRSRPAPSTRSCLAAFATAPSSHRDAARAHLVRQRYLRGVSVTRLAGGVVHELPADLRAALAANGTALAAWKDITPLARNEFICWVEDAKQAKTRERRIRRTVEELEEGMRRPCCWPGCTHRERNGR